jgi:hypothetical protein
MLTFASHCSAWPMADFIASWTDFQYFPLTSSMGNCLPLSQLEHCSTIGNAGGKLDSLLLQLILEVRLMGDASANVSKIPAASLLFPSKLS